MKRPLVIVAGNGFAGKLAALALHRSHDVTLLTDPRATGRADPSRTRLTGKPAHSHMFLPRIQVELAKFLPDILTALGEEGFAFQPGARGLRRKLPVGALRLFAMRWQLDAAMQALLDKQFTGKVRPFVITSAEVDSSPHPQRAVRKLNGAGKEASIDVPAEALVVDATGVLSPIMQAACKGTTHPQSYDSNIAYLSQFFRFREEMDTTTLSEPLFQGSVNFGNVYFSLYPARDGWFSLTAGFDRRNAETRSVVRTTQDMIDYAMRSEGLADWVSRADPVGRPAIFLNPQNKWSADLFADGLAPQNLLAVGDALTTTNPALGAGCA